MGLTGLLGSERPGDAQRERTGTGESAEPFELTHVELADPTGCGDAYRAGLLYGLVHGWDWVRTGRLASTLGALKIGSRGGQNHDVSRETVAALYRASYRDDPW